MKRTSLTILVAALASFCIVSRAPAQTTCGTLSGDETWSGSVLLSCPVSVPKGVTLTINPGSTIILLENAQQGNGKLTIYGQLKALSTVSTSPIVFATRYLGSAATGWEGFVISSGFVANHRLENVDFQRMGIKIASYSSGSNPKQKLTLDSTKLTASTTAATNKLWIDQSDVTITRSRIEYAVGIVGNNYNASYPFRLTITQSYLINTGFFLIGYTSLRNNVFVTLATGNVGPFVISGTTDDKVLFNTFVSLKPGGSTGPGINASGHSLVQGNLVEGFLTGIRFNPDLGTSVKHNNVSGATCSYEAYNTQQLSCDPPDGTNTELGASMKLKNVPNILELEMSPDSQLFLNANQVPKSEVDPLVTVDVYGLPRIGDYTIGGMEIPVIALIEGATKRVSPSTVYQNQKNLVLTIAGQNFEQDNMELEFWRDPIDPQTEGDFPIKDSSISITNIKVLSPNQMEVTVSVATWSVAAYRHIDLWNKRAQTKSRNRFLNVFLVGSNGAPNFQGSDLQTPANGGESRTGEVTFKNAIDSGPDTDKITYTCRFAKNQAMTDGLVEVTNVPQGTGGFTTCKAPGGTLTDNTVYYVQFVAYDGTGPELYNESSVYSFFYNTKDEPPTVPTLKTPQDGAKVPTTTPTLTIGNSSDPDSTTRTYQIQIATDSGFTSIVVDKASIAEDPSGETKLIVGSGLLSEDTTYYWRARALDTDDSLYSEWSTGQSFTINTSNTIPAAPALDVPKDGVEVGTNTPNLTVVNSTDPEGDPITYTFVIDTVNTLDSGDKQQQTVNENPGGKTTWTPDALEENTVYYWQVCVDDGSKSPNCTPIYSFKVNAQNEKPTIPQVKAPTNLSTIAVLRPDLVVLNSSDADGDIVQYHFQLSTTSDFSTTIIDNTSVVQGSGIDTTLKLLADLTEDTRYFWRVQAIDEHGLSSGWTSTQQFFVSVNNGLPPTPKLVSPQNGVTITTLTPALTAENVTDPEGGPLVYEFELDTDPSFSGVDYQRKEVPKSGGAQTSFTPATLKENLTYYWRVRVSDGNGTTAWSEVWSFTVDVDNQPPTNPVATSPDNGQVLTVFEVALNIENSTDPEGDEFDYVVQFYRDAGLSQKLGGDIYVKPQVGTKTIFTYGTNGELQKLGAGDFYWRVQAVDTKGGKSAWSNVAHFVINTGGNPGDDVTTPQPDTTTPGDDAVTPTDDVVNPTPDSTTSQDTGEPTNPDGSSGGDTGTTTKKSGGGCALAGSENESPAAALLLLLMLAVLVSRRRLSW